MTLKVDDLREIVSCIIDRYTPEKVILYGSYARGTYTDSSDLDLFIVMRFDNKTAELAAEIAAAIKSPIKLDVAVCTPEDFAASIGRNEAFLVNQIVKRGLVLYDQSAPRPAPISRSNDPPTH